MSPSRIIIFAKKFRLIKDDGSLGDLPFTLSRKASFTAAELASEYQLGKQG